MFPKATLAFLAFGTLSINALIIPVARAPEPEPGFRQFESREPQNWAEAIAKHYAVNKRGETQELEVRADLSRDILSRAVSNWLLTAREGEVHRTIIPINRPWARDLANDIGTRS